jgi:cupin fold WbuC family metalloprotein
MTLRTITQELIDSLIQKAAELPRKRTIYRLHEHHELVQRMVNALIPGTYVTPHKHEDPDKVELFSVLVGKVAVLRFDEGGAVQQIEIMDSEGAVRAVEIPPRMYHTLVALKPSALLEIIEGPYDDRTHKRFAPWAPLEDEEEVEEYQAQLAKLVAQELADF